MRAWKMTAGLAVAALIAALLAPRLFGAASTDPVASPASPVPRVPATSIEPPHPRADLVREKRQRESGAIPEVQQLIQAPPPTVPQPDPRLDDEWMDMVDCGMG